MTRTLTAVASPEDFWDQLHLPDLEVLDTFRLGVPLELNQPDPENPQWWPFWDSAEILFQLLPDSVQTLQLGLPVMYKDDEVVKDQIRALPWKSYARDWLELPNLKSVVIYTDYLVDDEEWFHQVNPWYKSALTKRLSALVKRNMLTFREDL